VAPTELPEVNSLLTLAVGVVVIVSLYLARDVLIPITLAVLLSFLLAPLASVLRRAHLPRTASVLLAVLLALGVIIGVGSVIGLQLASLSDGFPRYETALRIKVDTVRAMALREALALQGSLGGTPEKSVPATVAAPQRVPQGTAQSPVTVQVQKNQPTPLDLVRSLAGPVLSPLGTTALVLVVAVFILLQEDDLRDRMIRLFGSSDLHRTTLAMNDAARRLSKYFLTQLGINAGFGVLITVGLTALGVPSPALWGLIATLLRFVPYVGVYLSAAAPVALAAAVAPGWSQAVWTLGLFLGSELIVGQAIEPFARQRGGGDHLLDLDLGPDRPAAGDAADPVPGGARPAREAPGIPRCAARRPPGADAGGKPLPAHARQRPRGGGDPGRSAAARTFALRLLR
jgi:predicted PurR-regulated permease PerM